MRFPNSKFLIPDFRATREVGHTDLSAIIRQTCRR
jgi:hypothetical protein